VDIVGVAQDISLANDYSSLGVPRVESKHCAHLKLGIAIVVEKFQQPAIPITGGQSSSLPPSRAYQRWTKLLKKRRTSSFAFLFSSSSRRKT
jgi:hypothetical protein